MQFNDVWPQSLAIVRHGQSAGNVARELAEAGNLPVIDIQFRDIDTPLSELGHRQARALGRWYAQQPDDVRPNVILTSPYVRAMETAEELNVALKKRGDKIEIVFDERLREREFGALDRLTKIGITQRFPYEAELRARIGKFYYRPPGGESWADVILRLRSVLDSLARDYANQRVLIVCHSAVIFCLRYLFESMTEKQILDIERKVDIANCSLTIYRFEKGQGTAGKPILDTFNFVAPIEESNEPVTAEEDRRD